jgi:hypothetical protein
MLELEWTDTYDKFRQLHMRVAKRVQRLEQAPEADPEAPAESVGAGSLSDRHRKIQEQILARRKGGNSGLLHG